VFKSLLASYGRQNLLVPLNVNESGEPITGGEHRPEAMPVFPRPAGDVVCDADVERAKRLVRHDVKPTTHHLAIFTVMRLRKYQPHAEFAVRVATSPGLALAQVARTSRAMTGFASQAVTEFVSRAVTGFASRAMTEFVSRTTTGEEAEALRRSSRRMLA
jgi:hypothetical protein